MVKVAILLALTQNGERGGIYLIASQHEGLSSVIFSMRFVSKRLCMYACKCVCLRVYLGKSKFIRMLCMSGADNTDSLRS